VGNVYSDVMKIKKKSILRIRAGETNGIPYGIPLVSPVFLTSNTFSTLRIALLRIGW